MNEEANFCDKCRATVSLGAKFCSNCGYDLQNSSTQTPLNENEKVETDIDNPDHDTPSSGSTVLIILICVIALLIITINTDRKLLVDPINTIYELLDTEPDRKDKELQREQSKETAQSKPIVKSKPIFQSGWKMSGSADPASRVIIAESARVRSDDGLCQMSVFVELQGSERTEFECVFKFRDLFVTKLPIKFDNDKNYHHMDIVSKPKKNIIYVEPYYEQYIPDDPLSFDFTTEQPDIFSFKYDKFINGLISANFVAIQLISEETFKPVWIRFPIKGAKEAISKLGKELETAPNISND
jgi:hypothetical protein